MGDIHTRWQSYDWIIVTPQQKEEVYCQQVRMLLSDMEDHDGA